VSTPPPADALLASLRVSFASAALTLRVSGAAASTPVAHPGTLPLSAAIGAGALSAAPPGVALHAACAGVTAAARLLPGRHELSLTLNEWRAATPEGLFIRSADATTSAASGSAAGTPATSSSAFELRYAKLPPGGAHEHSVAASLRPIYVTATRATAERVLGFFRAAAAGVEGDDGMARLEAVAAEAAAAARAAARARLASALAQPSRLDVTLDVAAPKLLLPVSWFPAREGRAPYIMAIDLGRFALRSAAPAAARSAEGKPSDAAPEQAAAPLFETFELHGRDMEVFFAEPGFWWENAPPGDGMVNPAGADTPGSPSAAAAAPLPASSARLPFFRRIEFAARMQLATPAGRREQSVPDVHVSVRMPLLGWEISPLRFWRMNDSLKEFMDEWAPPPAKPWLRPAALRGAALVLTAAPRGGLRRGAAGWAPRAIAHAGAYVYVLEAPDAPAYIACCRLGPGTRCAAVPPEAVGGEAHCICVCDAGVAPAAAPQSRRALVLRFDDAAGAQHWLRVLRTTNARLTGAASRPAALGDLSSIGLAGFAGVAGGASAAAGATPAKSPLHGAGPSGGEPSAGETPSQAAAGTASPASSPVAATAAAPGTPHTPVTPASGPPSGSAHAQAQAAAAAEPERTRWVVSAEVGALSLRIGGRPLGLSGRGPDAPPPAPWGGPGESLLIAWDGRGGALTWRHTRTSIAIGLALDTLRIDDVHSGGVMMASAGSAPPPSDAAAAAAQESSSSSGGDGLSLDSMSLDDASCAAGGGAPAAADKPPPLADFRVSLWEITCPEYAGVDSRVGLTLSRVALSLRRPTLGSLWGVKDDCFGVPQSNEREVLQTRAATLGEAAGRVLVKTVISMREVDITLWAMPGSPLARIAATDLAVDARVFPATMAVSASLGGMRVANLKLPTTHRHHWLLDAKNNGGASPSAAGGEQANLVRIELRSFAPDDPDAPGYDYSLAAHASGVRVTYLHAFADEFSSWCTGMLPYNPHRRPVPPPNRAALPSGARPKMAIRIDASFEAPVIVVPRNTASADSVELDLGRASWATQFEWRWGSSVHDAGAVLLERTAVELSRIALVCVLGGARGESATRGAALRLTCARPLWDRTARVPLYDIAMTTPDLCMAVDDAEYLLLYGVMGSNLSETPSLLPRLVPLPEPMGTTTPAADAAAGAAAAAPSPAVLAPPVATAPPSGGPRATLRLSWRAPAAALELYHAPRASAARPLAVMRLAGFWTVYRGDSGGGWHTRWSFPSVSFRDVRPHTPADLRDVIGPAPPPGDDDSAPASSASSSIAHATSKSVTAASSAPTMWVMELGVTPGASAAQSASSASSASESSSSAQLAAPPGPGVFRLQAGLQRVRFLFDPEFILAVGRFFVPSLRPGLAEATRAALGRDLRPACDAGGTLRAPSGRVVLSPACRLLADAPGPDDEVLYDGRAGVLVLPPPPPPGAPPPPQLVFVGPGRTLRLCNVTVLNAAGLDACASLAAGARITADPSDNVLLVYGSADGDDTDRTTAAAAAAAAAAASAASAPVVPVAAPRRDLVLSLSATGLQLLLPESSAVGSSSSSASAAASSRPAASPARRALRARLDLSGTWRRTGGDSRVMSHLQHLSLSLARAPGRPPRPVLAPCDVLARLTIARGRAEASVDATDLEARMSVRTMALCAAVAADAARLFRGAPAALTAPCAAFDPVWSSSGAAGPGGVASSGASASSASAAPPGGGLSIWRPRAPDGFCALGDCATAGGRAPPRAVLALNDACGLAEAPLGFTRVWCSAPPGATPTLDDVTLWLPTAPPGFVALGCVAERGDAPPPRSAARCVRHEVLTRCGLGECVYTADATGAAAAAASTSDAGDDARSGSIGGSGIGAGGGLLAVASGGVLLPRTSSSGGMSASAIIPASAGAATAAPGGAACRARPGAVWCVDNGAGTFFASETLAPPPRDALCDLRTPLHAPRAPEEEAAEAAAAAAAAAAITAAAAASPSDAADARALDAASPRALLAAAPPALATAQAVEFVRVWWDKGVATRRRLSLWRPVAPPGFVVVGDAAVEGHEPPRRALVVADVPGAVARPLAFEQLWSSARSRCAESVSFWAPVPPPGYVSLGHVASRSLNVPPGLACVACVRADLAALCPPVREALWAEEGSGARARCVVWGIDPAAHTWAAAPGRARPRGPTYRLRVGAAGTSASAVAGASPQPGDTLHAEVRLARVTLLLLQPGAARGAPLAALTAHGVHAELRGAPGGPAFGGGAPPHRAAALSTTLGLHFFNAAAGAWEAVVEPAAVGISAGASPAWGRVPGAARVGLSVTSSLCVTLSVAAADAVMDTVARERAAAAAVAAATAATAAAAAAAAQQQQQQALQRRSSSTSALTPAGGSSSALSVAAAAAATAAAVAADDAADAAAVTAAAAAASDAAQQLWPDLDDEDLGAHTVFDNRMGRPLFLRYEAPPRDGSSAPGAAPGAACVVELQPDVPRHVAHAWSGDASPACAPAWWRLDGGDEEAAAAGPPAPRALAVRVRRARGAPAGDAARELLLRVELRLPSDEPQQARTAAAPPPPSSASSASASAQSASAASSSNSAASAAVPEVTWEEAFLLMLPPVPPHALPELLRRASLTLALVDAAAGAGAGADVACLTLSLRDALASNASGAIGPTGMPAGPLEAWFTLPPVLPGCGAELLLRMEVEVPGGAHAAQPPGGARDAPPTPPCTLVHVALSPSGPWAPLAVTNDRGRTLLPLPGGADDAAAVETELRNGMRHVRLRPLLTVHNATDVTLALCLAPGGGPAVRARARRSAMRFWRVIHLHSSDALRAHAMPCGAHAGRGGARGGGGGV
jgi:hypothetical protein